jgi:hypothetical protein
LFSDTQLKNSDLSQMAAGDTTARSTPKTHLAFKGSYNTYLNQGCTLYLGNSASAKETVTVSMKQNDGTSPVKDYSLTVPGRGVIAEDICAKSPKNFYGVVTVTATKPKRIYGVMVRKGEGERYKMATPLR